MYYYASIQLDYYPDQFSSGLFSSHTAASLTTASDTPASRTAASHTAVLCKRVDIIPVARWSKQQDTFIPHLLLHRLLLLLLHRPRFRPIRSLDCDPARRSVLLKSLYIKLAILPPYHHTPFGLYRVLFSSV